VPYEELNLVYDDGKYLENGKTTPYSKENKN